MTLFDRSLFILIICCASTAVKAQNYRQIFSNKGIQYLSRLRETLKILSDSMLSFSLEANSHKINYYLKEDTLHVKYGYRKVHHKYPILYASVDTILLKNNYGAELNKAHGEDTLTFINLEKLKEPIVGFKSLRLKHNSAFGNTLDISIDDIGEVSYSSDPKITAQNGKTTPLYVGKLSAKDFGVFKELLSKSFLTELKTNEGCRNFDAGSKEFTLIKGDEEIKIKTCLLYWPQEQLWLYLLNIPKSKSLKWAKKLRMQ